MSDTLVKRDGGAVQKQQGKPAAQQPRPTFTPPVDILELPEELVLLVELPGVKPGAVDINFERGELTVKARREPAPKQGRAWVQEFESGDFYRGFLISQEVAADKITAELKDGVLTVHLPKAAAALPRRISVKGS